MCAAIAEPRKIAFLIGNNKYNGNPLHSCVNDATDLSKELKRIGFIVTLGIDLNHEDMDKGIIRFTNSIKSGDLILFFFAGHGMQWEDQNYLIPCDDNRIVTQIDLKHRATNAQRVLELMSCEKPFVIVYLLDCCRSYWPPSIPRDRSMLGSSRGMAPMSVLAGSLVAFACAPGKTAGDKASNGRNGVFTYHLLQHITKPGEDITILMRDVTDGVAIETKEEQIPYMTSALRKRDIYLVPPRMQEAHPHLISSKVTHLSLSSTTNSEYRLIFLLQV
jgi:uncharacterized caspase-like protein